MHKVDLYDNAYGNFASNLYREIREQTYGHDLGQTSWVTREESEGIPHLLGLTAGSKVLEIGCGCGKYAIHLAGTIGCEVLGLDVNAHGVETANQLARSGEADSRVRFQQGDASQPLPFEDGAFDAAFANDVLCHIPGRLSVFTEILRVLRPGGRLLFSDALVIGGIVSQEEIARRSSIGYYLFSPQGENERLLARAGFQLLSAADTSANAAAIAQRWHDSRQQRSAGLIAIEGENNFQGVQQFLAAVSTLCAEGRLRRYLYVARKEA